MSARRRRPCRQDSTQRWLMWLGALAPAALAVGALPAPARAQLDVAAIDAAQRVYRGEPSALVVVRAALSTRTAHPGRVRDAMDRARATGWLPVARASIRRGQTVDLRGLTATGSDDLLTNVSTDDHITFEASLTFRFDQIVFADAEPTLLRELRALEEGETDLIREVVQLYFLRRRLQLERDLLGQRDIERAVRILEIEAVLDVFTNGAFGRMMRRAHDR